MRPLSYSWRSSASRSRRKYSSGETNNRDCGVAIVFSSATKQILAECSNCNRAVFICQDDLSEKGKTKGLAMMKRQPFGVERRNDLEDDLRHDLPGAFSGARASRNTEVIHWRPRASRRPDRNAAKSKIRAIEDIEEFSPKFKVDVFPN